MWHKYVCVRQSDNSDCGAAALATIALQHGLTTSVQQLRDLAGTDRSGTNLFSLLEAAEHLGFSGMGVKGDWESLHKVPLPAIAHFRIAEGQGHFVVLQQVSRSGVVISDPAKGVQRLSRESFADAWTGNLLLVTPDSARASHSRRTGQTPSGRILALIASHRGVLIESLVCAALMTLLSLSTSFFVQHLVDSILVRGESSLLHAMGIGMLLILVFRTLFSVLRQYLLAHISRKIDLSLISSYTRHLLALPHSFFEMRQVGDILSRVNDTTKIREAIGGATLTAVVDGAFVLVTTTVMWMYDPSLALVASLFSLLLLTVVYLHHPSTKRRSQQAMDESAQLSAHMVETVSGVETFKAFTAGRLRAEETERRLVGLSKSVFSLQMLNMSMTTAGSLVTAAAGIVVLWCGGQRVIQGAISIGELMFFYTLLGYTLSPLERLASVNLQVQEALVAVERLYQVLDLPKEGGDRGKGVAANLRQSIELRNVSFRYGCRENVLSDVNLTIPAGATVAIVGESGCGKSTLLKLLMRFYEPTAGQLLIDGTDLRDFDLLSLRHRIGLVTQDPFILTGSIRDNIGLGDPDATLDDIVAVTQTAGLSDFVARMPDRYDTMIGERGANLSGGQKQRLAIARALLKCPEILLLDEATSHLDTKTESAIQHSLRTVLADKTVVLVAHRLSTIREADMICVMHEGRIVEQGSHHQLLALNGRYAALWQIQSQGTNDSATRPPFNALRNGHSHPRLAEPGAKAPLAAGR